MAWTCYRVENGFFRFSKLVEQRAFSLVLHTTVGLCTVCAKRADSVYSLRMFDRTGDSGDMLDQEHRGERMESTL